MPREQQQDVGDCTNLEGTKKHPLPGAEGKIHFSLYLHAGKASSPVQYIAAGGQGKAGPSYLRWRHLLLQLRLRLSSSCSWLIAEMVKAAIVARGFRFAGTGSSFYWSGGCSWREWPNPLLAWTSSLVWQLSGEGFVFPKVCGECKVTSALPIWRGRTFSEDYNCCYLLFKISCSTQGFTSISTLDQAVNSYYICCE